MDATIEPDQFLIIIGSAKCGTTSLFDYLSQHPAVCASAVKEPEYFTEHQTEHPRYALRVRRYEDYWPDFNPAVNRYALEGSTGYTKWPLEEGVAERMYAYGLRPRFVYVVRDPIARIESHVNFRRANSRQQVSFDDAFFVDISRYATQLSPYVRVFGREAIQVVDFARLCADPNTVCAEIYNWLGLEPHTIADPAVSNRTSSLRTSRLYRVDSLRKIAWIFPSVVREIVKRTALKLFPYDREHVRLTPERAQEIRASLQTDVAGLSREWDIDIAAWGFTESAQ
ncbi:MAG: sulfotransferase domain-containing protein [Actinomycetia bacterium]|nr:sulfotransferase domain-containing protein [Actinomycetes bacterium]